MSNDTKALIVLACVFGVMAYAVGAAFSYEDNEYVLALVVAMVSVVITYVLFYKPDDKEK